MPLVHRSSPPAPTASSVELRQDMNASGPGLARARATKLPVAATARSAPYENAGTLLWVAIDRSPLTFRNVARLMGVDKAVLSDLVDGYRGLTDAFYARLPESVQDNLDEEYARRREDRRRKRGVVDVKGEIF